MAITNAPSSRQAVSKDTERSVSIPALESQRPRATTLQLPHIQGIPPPATFRPEPKLLSMPPEILLNILELADPAMQIKGQVFHLSLGPSAEHLHDGKEPRLSFESPAPAGTYITHLPRLAELLCLGRVCKDFKELVRGNIFSNNTFCFYTPAYGPEDPLNKSFKGLRADLHVRMRDESYLECAKCQSR